MPLPLVAVDIAPPSTAGAGDAGCEADPGGRRSPGCEALLEACTAAAFNAVCVPISEGRGADTVVLVAWRGPRAARVEVLGRGGEQRRWMRDLEFEAADATLEKWRSVGYAVGSLASEASAGRGESAAESAERGKGPAETAPSGPAAEAALTTSASGPTTKAEGDAPRAASSGSERTHTMSAVDESRRQGTTFGTAPWSAEVGALLGTAITGGAPRAGGFLRMNRSFDGPLATAAFSYSVRGGDEHGVSARFLAVSLGGGWEFRPAGWVGLHTRGELVLEYLSVGIDDEEQGRTDSTSTWVGGARGSIAFSIPADSVIAFLVGGDATLRARRTDIRVGSTPVGSIPVADFVLDAGLRVEWR
jgi:hypothetical protein